MNGELKIVLQNIWRWVVASVLINISPSNIFTNYAFRYLLLSEDIFESSLGPGEPCQGESWHEMVNWRKQSGSLYKRACAVVFVIVRSTNVW